MGKYCVRHGREVDFSDWFIIPTICSDCVLHRIINGSSGKLMLNIVFLNKFGDDDESFVRYDIPYINSKYDIVKEYYNFRKIASRKHEVQNELVKKVKEIQLYKKLLFAFGDNLPPEITLMIAELLF